jgi:peptidoglycan/LPS O-acetylase OafA/YrhL
MDKRGARDLLPGGNHAPVFPHIQALDGLRGFAVLLVLFHHLMWSNPHTGNRLMDFFSSIRLSSYLGVNVFFVLSGYLITNILLNSVKREGYFKNFYARRALRIFPLYYGVLIFLMCMTRPLHIVWNGWQYYFLTYTTNHVFWQRPPLILPNLTLTHLGTLQVEEQFYLIWPFVIYKVRRMKNLILWALFTCGLVLLVRITVMANQNTLHNVYLAASPLESCADALLYGCCLAAILRTRYREAILHNARWVFAAAALILMCVWTVNGSLLFLESWFMPTLGFTVVDLGCVALLAMAIQNGTAASRIFSTPSLRFFGKYSYGLYIFHYPIFEMIGGPIRAAFNRYTGSKFFGVVGPALVVGGITLVISMISFHTYEAFFLNMKRFFDYKRQAVPAVRPEVSIVNS